MEILTAIGMASSAGLNAYIPLIVAGLLARYTGLLTLGPGWEWLENPWTLGLLGVLLVIEFFADKIPAVDSVNDVIQTVVRPASGGIVFGASGTALAAEATAADAGDGGSVWMVVAGAVIALVFHGAKALLRPVVNTLTAGVGAPVASTAEDTASVLMSLLAVVVPILVLVFVPLLLLGVVWARRRVRLRRERKTDRRTAGKDLIE
ncbi:DUF4126 domain-containing protein [Actinorugispora endophytica]|uniref:Uncharacterized protein DUF4126 n=1 Tax=Actinorugispora endophytica TaxID=1605990 RepID=A0A4R6UY50_9ACTN|nr:DUF4126 domain-containing protein [Actinorugispora endophytica]TDQ52430.1 uncharacterized protein DUF4126 [Actinorugispora endophytica]